MEQQGEKIILESYLGDVKSNVQSQNKKCSTFSFPTPTVCRDKGPVHIGRKIVRLQLVFSLF